MNELIPVDDTWDAGSMGCGELVFRLAMRLRAMRPGAVLKLTATDSSAHLMTSQPVPHDRYPLLRAEHPHYYIERKDT